MRKNEKRFYEKISNDCGLSEEEIKAVIMSINKDVSLELKNGNEYYIPSLGTFIPKKTKPRKIRNISTGKPSVTKNTATISFKPTLKLKQTIQE